MPYFDSDVRAVVQDRYGPPEVLRIADVARPEPKADEVLIRIHASTVSQSDTHLRAPDPVLWRLVAGLRRPRWRTPGVELAEEVEAVGAAVTEFKVGQSSTGATRWSRSSRRTGTWRRGTRRGMSS